MANIEAFPNRLPARVEAQPRIPPGNLEAEQALLGAILINNDAYDRVSDFLRPEHFVEEIHRRIYEIAGSLIRAGKIASPITLKTFLGEHDLGGGLTVQQYLARLALEATTIINAHDYGRAIHDLAIAPRADPHRRGHRQRRLRRAGRLRARASRSRRRRSGSIRSPRAGSTAAASRAFPTR